MDTGSYGTGEVAVAADETKSDTDVANSEADVAKDEARLGSRAPEFVKARRMLHVSWQVAVFVIGLAVVVAGVIMLPLPGPGWLVIFGGMAIWATEFVWAQLVLRWTKRKVSEATQRALDPRVRRRNIILTTIGLVIVSVLVGFYVWKFGLEMPWNIKDQ
ncbi:MULTISPECIES: TIGR02611 family protein [Streptomyces]|uniref:TIGR02611 family protein n=1 Tax=Streptomyces TaxID=1883 RepID=UPI0004E72E4C|nr:MULTISPECIES: TIGR02611 family protein [Streptomyces]KFF97322.1 membrane protein [Streptomyces scabiei]MDX3585656.1 TIGR02611 family protein [Streptomyces europaeiscabiei]MDX3630170.1 TIGR02611 family protein [Streptomyces europaeiscabiei]MDX3652422.1 TIGR02611 family protein [Streptomyces europaeiscabiei]MDX3692804.1 TIGR02611 family protein [Streptomyces europaeiscabiei]